MVKVAFAPSPHMSTGDKRGKVETWINVEWQKKKKPDFF